MVKCILSVTCAARRQRMRRTIPYGFLYRTGRTPWDTGVTPPEVVELVEGKTPLPPGRALDLGCGTGNEVAYLARHGWTATGVDLVQVAIDRAASKIEGFAERRRTPRRRHEAWRDGTGWPLRPGARLGMLPFPLIRWT